MAAPPADVGGTGNQRRISFHVVWPAGDLGLARGRSICGAVHSRSPAGASSRAARGGTQSEGQP
eukprot:13231703-Alexandrium_andersonii.AAC.1